LAVVSTAMVTESAGRSALTMIAPGRLRRGRGHDAGAHQHPGPTTDPTTSHPADPGLIPLTVAEIKRLADLGTRTGRALAHHLRWLWWRRRRRHQARARWFQQRTRLRRSLQPPRK
jgi:hypothetical protein